MSEEEDIAAIGRKIKAAAKKLWAHPIGKPLVYVLLGFILGATVL